MIELRPITRDASDAFIRQHHRHHGVPVGALWRHAAHDDAGNIVGVAVVGRPVARALDDGLTVEVTRLATNGEPNACSMLYAAARRAAIAKGYRRGLTYILASEDGASLRAVGWNVLWTVDGRSWDVPSRPRTDKHPTEDKVAYGWGAFASTARSIVRVNQAALAEGAPFDLTSPSIELQDRHAVGLLDVVSEHPSSERNREETDHENSVPTFHRGTVAAAATNSIADADPTPATGAAAIRNMGGEG